MTDSRCTGIGSHDGISFEIDALHRKWQQSGQRSRSVVAHRMSRPWRVRRDRAQNPCARTIQTCLKHYVSQQVWLQHVVYNVANAIGQPVLHIIHQLLLRRRPTLADHAVGAGRGLASGTSQTFLGGRSALRMRLAPAATSQSQKCTDLKITLEHPCTPRLNIPGWLTATKIAT